MKPLEFLKWLRPDGPWVLTAIHPDNGSVIRSIMPVPRFQADPAYVGPGFISSSGNNVLRTNTRGADSSAAVAWPHYDPEQPTSPGYITLIEATAPSFRVQIRP
jgi:hypothetical protein